jgi:type II secretory pathway component PulF
MPEFKYRALDRKGATVSGLVDAPDLAAAHNRLRHEGVLPFEVRAHETHNAPIGFGSAIQDNDLADYLSDLQAIISAGVPLRAGLEILRDAESRPRHRNLLANAARRISEGQGATQALSPLLGKHDFIRALLDGASKSGRIDEAFRFASQTLSRSIALRSEFWGAVSYPVALIIGFALVLATIVLLVIPSLTPLVEEAQGEMEGLLKWLIDASAFVGANPFLVVALSACLFFAIGLFALLPALKRPRDVLALSLPGSRVILEFEFGRWAVAMGRLLQADVGVLDAMQTSCGLVKNIALHDAMASIEGGLREGSSLSAGLRGVKHCPPMILRFIDVGEATGQLGLMLERAGEQLQGRAIRSTRRISSVVGPAALVAIGFLVAVVMGGLMTGIANIGAGVL